MRRSPVSRAALLWGVALFVLTQLALGVLLETAWPLFRFPSARQALTHLPPAPAVVFAGSSRFGCAIDAAEIERLTAASVATLTVPAGEPVCYELLLDQMLARGVRPAWLAVEVAPENVCDPSAWMAVHATRQLGWGHLPTHLPEVARANSAGRYAGSLLFPVYVHRDHLRQALSDPPVVARDAPRERATAAIDWDTMLQLPRLTSSAEQRQRLTDGAAAARLWLRNYRLGGQNTLALERLLRRCARERIGVLLVVPPLASQHRAEYLPSTNAAFDEYLAALTAAHGCRVIDARDWLPDELFRDASHADIPVGTQHFSRLLTRRVFTAPPSPPPSP